MKPNFKDFFLSLSERDQVEYAERAKTTANYIRTHLITRYKIPRKDLMQRLVDASNGSLKINDLTSFFYEENKAA